MLTKPIPATIFKIAMLQILTKENVVKKKKYTNALIVIADKTKRICSVSNFRLYKKIRPTVHKKKRLLNPIERKVILSITIPPSIAKKKTYAFF